MSESHDSDESPPPESPPSELPPPESPPSELPASELPASELPPTVRLDQFLKLAGVTATGGQAKLLIQGGEVFVNGEIETRRRRKLVAGDVVGFDGEQFEVVAE